MDLVKEKQNKIDYFVNSNNVPNLLIYGPYLNGKEDLCKYFINKVYTKDSIKKYVLTINCLSNSGIKMIKDNIKLFSMQIINKSNNIHFKTIILQYCEYLTYDSQYSLRRTIEQFSKNTRFILLCENKNKLLNPICSRFVHIYVNNNLHNIYFNDFVKFKYVIFNKIIKDYEKNKDNLNSILQLSKELYLNNFYSYEILSKFKKHINYNLINMIFEKVCHNLRNEELCIFYLLNIFRNNLKIQIYELY